MDQENNNVDYLHLLFSFFIIYFKERKISMKRMNKDGKRRIKTLKKRL